MANGDKLDFAEGKGSDGDVRAPVYSLNFTVWYCVVWYGTVRYGMVWYGIVLYGMVWYDGTERYGMVWYGMVGMVWYGTVRYGTVWYGMLLYFWYCTVLYCIVVSLAL